MSRMLASLIVVGGWSVFGLGVLPAVFAQVQPGNPTARQPRPGNAALQVQNLSPQLEQLLRVWSQQSAGVQKLQGTHRRFVYDKVFQVEKRAMGVFYYEAPGKGRIDLSEAPIANGEQSRRLGEDGKTPYKLQPDRPERWTCDGKDIWQVNDVTKQVEVFPIPKENQGQNIMDGPLPFLFGMPPEKAKRRYFLKLISETKEQAVLEVHPRTPLDAKNWKQARVIIDKSLYLPRAVQLIAPAGNSETVYTFSDFKVNSNGPNLIQKIFRTEDENPFRPRLPGYTFKVHNPQENQPQAPQAPGEYVPTVAGLGWKDAKERLEKLGCQVKIFTGQKAPQEKFTYVVYDQKPAAKSPLKKGQEVMLTIYDKAPVQVAVNNPPAVPAVQGMFWKDAGQKLEQAGYKVKYVPGQAAPSQDKTYLVYQQTPNAGQTLAKGGEITLTVYNKPN